MANRKVILLRYCKTEKGWRRFPVFIGKNGRLKPDYVLEKGEEKHRPIGHYELRSYQGSKAVYKNIGTNAAEALNKRDRESQLLVARDAAAAGGAVLVEESAGPKRLLLSVQALKFEDDAKERGALESAEVNRLVCDEFIAVTRRVYADEIVKDDIYKFHRALKKRGLSDRTISNKHKRLRSFLIFCKLPHKEIMPPTPKYVKTKPNRYTTEDIDKILKVADDYLRMVIEIGLMCGLRDQEIQHLEWSDIRWEDSILKVTSKPHWGFKIKDYEEREIPVPSKLLTHLRQWREKQIDSRLVLPTRTGKPEGKLLRRLKRLAKAHGLNCGVCEGCQSKLGECQEWTLHKLRRTYCTTLLQSGLDLSTVQHYMGHNDLASTMRYLRPATAEQSHAKINAIWS